MDKVTYDTSSPPPPPPPDQKKHSGIGIASFVVSIIAGILICVTFAAAGFTPENLDYTTMETVYTGIGLLACGTIIVSLVGLGLGIGGLVQAGRSKLFGILGLAFNLLILLALCAIILIGLLAGGAL